MEWIETQRGDDGTWSRARDERRHHDYLHRRYRRHRGNPHIGVIVLTMFEDDESVFSALKAGARGYVLKDAGRGTLLRAFRAGLVSPDS